jgi:hypothetical protein
MNAPAMNSAVAALRFFFMSISPLIAAVGQPLSVSISPETRGFISRARIRVVA